MLYFRRLESVGLSYSLVPERCQIVHVHHHQVIDISYLSPKSDTSFRVQRYIIYITHQRKSHKKTHFFSFSQSSWVAKTMPSKRFFRLQSIKKV